MTISCTPTPNYRFEIGTSPFPSGQLEVNKSHEKSKHWDHVQLLLPHVSELAHLLGGQHGHIVGARRDRRLQLPGERAWREQERRQGLGEGLGIQRAGGRRGWRVEGRRGGGRVGGGSGGGTGQGLAGRGVGR